MLARLPGTARSCRTTHPCRSSGPSSRAVRRSPAAPRRQAPAALEEGSLHGLVGSSQRPEVGRVRVVVSADRTERLSAKGAFMRAMVYRGPYKVRVEEKEMPAIEHPNDAIVRVSVAAICGSDLHLYHGMMPDTRVGMTFGHEFIGV